MVILLTAEGADEGADDLSFHVLFLSFSTPADLFIGTRDMSLDNIYCIFTMANAHVSLMLNKSLFNDIATVVLKIKRILHFCVDVLFIILCDM